MGNLVAEHTVLDEQAIARWLVGHLSGKLDMAPEQVDPAMTFAEQGVDSMMAIVMSGDLAEWSGRNIDPTVLYEYPTIAALAKYVSTLGGAGKQP
jgi:acyl carrier protein